MKGKDWDPILSQKLPIDPRTNKKLTNLKRELQTVVIQLNGKLNTNQSTIVKGFERKRKNGRKK